MRSNFRVGSLCGLLLGGFLISGFTPPPAALAAPPSDLQRLLSEEAAGVAVDRAAALHASPEDPAAHWHAGEVLLEGRWVKLEELSGEHTPAPLRRYAELRGRTTLDVAGHRELAAWAGKHRLPEIADAHRQAILWLEPEDERTRRELGHKNVGGVWFTAEEMAEAEADERARVEALKRWMPQVRKLTAALESSDTRRRLEAIEELKTVDAGAAVALRYAALQVGEDAAAQIVAALGRMRSEEACSSLVHLALADPTGKSGRAAVEALQAYPPHYYVPDLLAMLQTSTQVRSKTLLSRNGDVVLEQVYLSEGRDAKQEHVVRRLIAVQNRNPQFEVYARRVSLRRYSGDIRLFRDVGADGIGVTQWTKTRSSSGPRLSESIHNKTADLARTSLAEAVAEQGEREADADNYFRNDLSARAALILSNVSNLPAGAPPQEFWSWWPRYNERGTGYKPTRRTSVDDYRNPVLLSTRSYDIVPMSCLVRGTPVQTACGLRPVESIEVGDLLPAVDVRTGELSLEPVSLRSSRTAERTFVIRTAGGESVEASGGHYWWVAGRGWVRTRELEPGMLLRTADASVEVASVEMSETPKEVFNVVVDGSHTYFVGSERWLSWDVTELEPTLLRAPGYRPGEYVATR